MRSESLSQSSRDFKIGLCRALLNLRLNGEIERALLHLTEDSRFEIVGDDAFSPYSGASVGRRAIGQKLHMLHVAFEYSNVDPYLFVVEGDHLMARFRARFRNRGTGPSAAMEGIAHVTFRGAEICYFSIFVDTAAVARLSNV